MNKSLDLDTLIDRREAEAAKIARARRGLPGLVDPRSIPYGDRPWPSVEDRFIADLLVKAGLTIVDRPARFDPPTAAPVTQEQRDMKTLIDNGCGDR